jgi:hypothetical protein
MSTVRGFAVAIISLRYDSPVGNGQNLLLMFGESQTTGKERGGTF